MKIKICGLRHEKDARYANEARPDYAGMILAKGFRRSISVETARKIKAKLMSDICAVGVFVNDPAEEIVSLLNEGVIDIAQLHGQENEEDVMFIKASTGKPVIKALKLGEDPQVDRFLVEAWLDSAADYLLFDAGTGSGKTFDWSGLQGLDAELGGNWPKEFFLAGGLHPGNLEEAFQALHPYAVDLSSGVETDGMKDLQKMRQAVDIVRALS